MQFSNPLVTHLYTADPSAHVFENRLYFYPSHDRDTEIADNDNGDQYDMNDYHVYSLPSLTNLPQSASSPSVTDHGIVLDLPSVPWASTQLWAPDAAYNPHTKLYHLFFPARDKQGIFRIGTAVGKSPAGPFTADENYLSGSYSIDPASFVDDDEEKNAYLYFGGLWGGQLQCWQKPGTFNESLSGPQEPAGNGVTALGPRIAKLSRDMHSLAETPVEIQILARDRRTDTS